MLDLNKKLFDDFRALHDKYAFNEGKWQDEFNREGEKILTVVREWENKLCRQSEKAGYGNYTNSLSEKFRAEVKKQFSLIDNVGLLSKNDSPFTIRKIKL